jgi:transketolase
MEQLMKCLHGKYPCNLRPLIDVIDIEEGNNIEAIIAGMTDAKSEPEKEACLLLHTEMGNGDYMMYSHAWHGKHQMMHNLKTH